MFLKIGKVTINTKLIESVVCDAGCGVIVNMCGGENSYYRFDDVSYESFVNDLSRFVDIQEVQVGE